MMEATSVDEELELALNGNRRAMARVLSSIENGEFKPENIPPKPPSSENHAWAVMAITGAPGVGKSVLVDALMTVWASDGIGVALLAVDPSSPRTGGALLGDRVRMTSVDNPAISDRVYVRSIATRTSSGSVPLIVEDMAAFLLACGWDRVLIETVGSGQAELRCAAVADRIVVVEGPARGDGIQAEKAGLLELADIVLVNKADLEGAERHAGELTESYALDGDDAPDVLLTSGLKGIGVPEAAKALLSLPGSNRALRARMRERLLAQHERRLVQHPAYNVLLDGLCEGTLDITEALTQLKGDDHERAS